MCNETLGMLIVVGRLRFCSTIVSRLGQDGVYRVRIDQPDGGKEIHLRLIVPHDRTGIPEARPSGRVLGLKHIQQQHRTSPWVGLCQTERFVGRVSLLAR